MPAAVADEWGHRSVTTVKSGMVASTPLNDGENDHHRFRRVRGMCIARLSVWLELDALQAAAGVTVCLKDCYKPRKQHQDHVDDGAYMPAI